MRYFTPEEIRANKDLIKEKFELRPGKRVLVLKGKNVGIFQEFVPDFQAKILDAGIGSGAFVQAISDKGYANIFACDIDEYMAAGAKPLLKEFRTLDISFDPLPWPDNFFDALTAWDVLEHVENPYHAVREFQRVLKPGGIFIFSVPNVFHIVSRLVFLKRGLFPRWNASNNHISIIPRGIFDKMFLNYFKLVKEGYVYSKIHLPFLNKIKFLPENQWFSDWVYYVLEKERLSEKKQTE